MYYNKRFYTGGLSWETIMGDMIVQWSVVCHNSRCIDGIVYFWNPNLQGKPWTWPTFSRSISVDMIDNLLKCLKWRNRFWSQNKWEQGKLIFIQRKTTELVSRMKNNSDLEICCSRKKCWTQISLPRKQV